MKFYEPKTYTRDELEELEEREIVFPFCDEDATYNGKTHQYTLTAGYFYERGRNLELEVEGTDPEKVKHFLQYLTRKVYNYIYIHSKSTRNQINYLIAKRALRSYSPYEYRQAFLEAMFLEGCYLLDNGDLGAISGVDFDTMSNVNIDVMRNQDRDMHPECVKLLKELGLNYYGRYKFIPDGNDW